MEIEKGIRVFEWWGLGFFGWKRDRHGQWDGSVMVFCDRRRSKTYGVCGVGAGVALKVLQTPMRKYCRNFTEISFKLMENFRWKKWKNNKKENRKKKKRKLAGVWRSCRWRRYCWAGRCRGGLSVAVKKKGKVGRKK